MQLSASITQVPQSIYEVLELYEHALAAALAQGNFNMTKTALLRYTVPAWGGPEAQGKGQIAPETIEFLRTVPVKGLNKALEVQEQYFSQIGVDHDCKRRNRFYLKKLIDWAHDQNWLNTPSHGAREVYRFNKPKGQGRRIVQDVRSTSLSHPRANALGTAEGDFVTTKSGSVLGNKTLDQELKALSAYIKRTTGSDRSVERAQHYTKRILGWLHRQKHMPLEHLSLTQIIPFTQMRFSDKDFENDPAFERNSKNQYLYPKEVHEKGSASDNGGVS